MKNYRASHHVLAKNKKSILAYVFASLHHVEDVLLDPRVPAGAYECCQMNLIFGGMKFLPMGEIFIFFSKKLHQIFFCPK